MCDGDILQMPFPASLAVEALQERATGSSWRAEGVGGILNLAAWVKAERRFLAKVAAIHCRVRDGTGKGTSHSTRQKASTPAHVPLSNFSHSPRSMSPRWAREAMAGSSGHLHPRFAHLSPVAEFA